MNNITCNEKDNTLPEYEIGKYGRLHLEYMKKHRRHTYDSLLMSGELNQELHEVDKTCERQMILFIHAMAEHDGVTEEMKDTDPMKWVGLMNNYKHCAEEVILEAFVYV